MKNSMKRHLILALVVVAMVITTVFAVSAASSTDKYYCPKCKAEVSVYIKETVEPKCESEGYNIIACNGVRKDENGNEFNCEYVFQEIRADKTSATGHKYEDITYVKPEADSSYYEARSYCKNSGCNLYTTKGGATNPIKYHKVTFVNLCTTKTLTDLKYTKLATEWQGSTIAERYIAKGSSLSNIGAKRDADYNYGEYKLVGWTTNIADAYPDATGLDYAKYTTTVAIAKDDTVADRTVYAVFQPVEVQYTISFYAGKILSGTLPKITVTHGKSIVLPDSYKHEKADDMTYRYSFSHWAVQDHSDVEISNGTPIYGKMNLAAIFTPIAKEYKFAYYLSYTDEKVNTPVKIGGEAVTDIVCPATGKRPVNGLDMNKEATDDLKALYSYSTLEYDYKFTGKWIVANGQAAGRELDLNNLDLSKMLDTVASSNPIILLPKYKAIERLYSIEIKAGFIDDMDATEHPTEATLQITDDSGLVLTQKLTRNPEDPYFRYTAKVPYTDKYYRISVVSGAYAGSAESEYIESKGRFSNVVFDMERKGKDHCNCLCHSLIKPIWVKVLNVVYSLFGKKIVCCDDLFAENGHLLNYTAND